MREKRRRQPEKDPTRQYRSGELEEKPPEQRQKFARRFADAQQNKTLRTALMRAAEQAQQDDIESLPTGQVVQVFSLFSEVEHDGVRSQCVTRKTLSAISATPIVVGDRVRFRDTELRDEQGRAMGVIEQVLPRETILTRADPTNPIEQQPIVANAQQMLIVVSLLEPIVRWGLVDRMTIAAQSGALRAIVCLNKIDLARGKERATALFDAAQEVLAHYRTLGVATLQTSLIDKLGIDELRDVLRNQVTVLAGHSGVGKSSLIRSIEPDLDIRVGAISGYTGKGRHTTTSTRRYELSFGGAAIDTPGVKLFGLWGVTRDNLMQFFPDIETDTAPDWRRESFQRIFDSLG